MLRVLKHTIMTNTSQYRVIKNQCTHFLKSIKLFFLKVLVQNANNRISLITEIKQLVYKQIFIHMMT